MRYYTCEFPVDRVRLASIYSRGDVRLAISPTWLPVTSTHRASHRTTPLGP